MWKETQPPGFNVIKVKYLCVKITRTSIFLHPSYYICKINRCQVYYKCVFKCISRGILPG
jgi:hypothetical protein